MTVTYERRWVTPETAAEYLRGQIVNRNLAAKKVEEIARDLLAGSYRENGDTAKLGEDRVTMIDGQHRCAAVIRAKELKDAHIEWAAKEGRELTPEEAKPFEGVYMVFAVGVPKEARHTIDTARRRTAADVLAMRGGTNTGIVMAIVGWHLRWTKGNLMATNGGSLYTPSITEQMAHYESDPDRFHTSALRGKDVARQRITTATTAGVAYHILRTQFGDDLTEGFFGPFVSGADLGERNPILVVRNKLISGKFPRAEVLALIIKAWNHWGEAREVDSIYLKNKLTSANFPRPKHPKSFAESTWDE